MFKRLGNVRGSCSLSLRDSDSRLWGRDGGRWWEY